jgi:hypothetical protein
MKAKLYIGTLAALIWVAAVVGRHFWPDLDIGAIVLACGSVLSGLGVYHVADTAINAPATPVDKAQGGFAYIPLLLAIAIFAIGWTLTGCASMMDAGHTAYSFEPTIGADGKATGGCKFTASDGKEYASRNIAATSTATGCQVIVQEGASTAFQGQAIAEKALSILPSFAPILLPPGPASIVPQLQAAPATPAAAPPIAPGAPL